ncbi:hypothetical protein BH11BAC3_BH11BAC3_28830 [soil metagenome]
MDHQFEIPVTYKGEDILLAAFVQPGGYTTRIAVEVDVDQIILFEQDEEGNYRGLVPFDADTKETDVDKELLGLIAEVLNSVR